MVRCRVLLRALLNDCYEFGSFFELSNAQLDPPQNLPDTTRWATHLWRALVNTHDMPASEQDLIDALSRVAMGDRAAFKLVYAATSAKLFSIVGRILRRHDLAEEVLQEVYIRVWQRAGDFDPTISSPITWLVAIARNRALDEVRRKPMESLDERPNLLELPTANDALADHGRNEERLRLQACLDRLEPEKSEIVQLAYVYGMTRAEIASRINRPASTVKTWLRRSLAHLKDCLSS